MEFIVTTESTSLEEREIAMRNAAIEHGVEYTPSQWFVECVASWIGGPYKWLVEDEESHSERIR